ncbi:MAG: hypothetical protein KGR98_03940, partial [Verrucomicrobia bacterium]|nr:hypothetical protein [Verrucomicrobiota bacterium]
MRRTAIAILIASAALSAFAQAGGPYGTPYNATGYQTNQSYSSAYYATNNIGRAYPVLPRRIGVGLILGEPVGVSAKYWLNDVMAVDAAAGVSSHSHSDLYVHADVLWHNFNVFNFAPVMGRMPLYFGVGGLLRFRNHGEGNDAGIRVPVGVSYMFDNIPVDIFAEIAPAI